MTVAGDTTEQGSAPRKVQDTTHSSFGAHIFSSPVTLRFGIVLLAIAVIEFVGRNRLLGPSMVISFTEMLGGLLEIIQEGVIQEHFVITLYGYARALAWALPLGFLTGACMWRIRIAGRALEPYLIAAWSVPWFFFYPAFLSIFGLGSIPVIIVAGIMMVIPVTIAAYGSLKEVPASYLRVATSYQLEGKNLWLKILVPAMAPQLFAGIRVALVWGLAATIAMEFIASTGGLGFFVKTRLEWFQPRSMYGGILIIAAMGMTIAVVMRWLESRIRMELA